VETFLTYICEHAAHAHLIIFALIMIAGLNIPISEDLLVITGGAIASTCLPEESLQSYLLVFSACWLSAWETYWIGRLLGPKLFEIHWFSRLLPPSRIKRIEYYLHKFGILTFIIGRFIPGGVRNALFMCSGLTKMPFHIFIFRDGIGCLFASASLFYIGYVFGEHYQEILHYLKMYEEIISGIVIFLLVSAFLLLLKSKKWPTTFHK
jgi:membrane-associated protein